MRGVRTGSLIGGLIGGLAACTDTEATGPASSSAHPTVRSATTTVENVELLQPVGTYRRWTIEILEDEPGTPCVQRGTPLVTIAIYTSLPSAPRGELVLSMDPPPRLIPAAYATTAEGFTVQGTLAFSAAATTLLIGELTGEVTIAGAPRPLEISFEAPTCVP